MLVKYKPINLWVAIYISSLFLIYGALRPIVEIVAVIGILTTLKTRKINNRPYVILGASFVALCFLSCLWSGDVSASLYATRGALECYICSIVIQFYAQSSEEGIENLIKYSIIMCFVMMLRIFLSVPMDQILNRQFLGIYNANSVGIRFSICCALSFWCFKESRHGNRYLIFSFILGFLGLLSGSKKALVIVLIGIIVLQIMYSKNIFGTIKYIILAACLVAGSYYLIMNNAFLYSVIGSRVEGLLNGLQYGVSFADASTKERMILIQYASERWKERALLGHGINSFASVIGYTGYGAVNLYVHNNYLEILFGLGIIGTVIYYMIFAINLFHLKRVEVSGFIKLSILMLAILLFLDSAMVSYGDEFAQYILAIYCAVSFYKKNENGESVYE